MDIRKVKKLIEMLEDSNLEEIEIQEGEESVRLVKGNRQNQSYQTQPLMIPQASSVQEQPPEEVSLHRRPLCGLASRGRSEQARRGPD